MWRVGPRTVARRSVWVTVAIAGLALLAPSGAPPPAPQGADAATLPAGFQETVVFSGLTNPTVVRFASDGRVFVAEKSGLIKVFDSLLDPTPTTSSPTCSTNVHNFWDRGLLGLALHPNFPATPYVYVLYTYDHGDRRHRAALGTAAWLATPARRPPGATPTAACVSGRLSRARRRPATS